MKLSICFLLLIDLFSGHNIMASANSFFDDMRIKPEVIDPPQNEDVLDVGESLDGPAPSSLKPNLAVLSSVRELLECPVCLNAMYPPIHQVQFHLNI